MSCPDIPSSPDMADGLSLLDLGCGWGSVALYMAAKFPNSQGAVYLYMDETQELNINIVTVTALSNSDSQRLYIEEQARNKGLSNLKVITGEVEFQLL